MKRILYISLILAAAACSCGGSKEPATPTGQETVSVNPTELSCAASASVLTLNVTASAAFQAYAEDGIGWVSVKPSYSAEKTAAVTVSVDDNIAYQPRETYITIKCGTTRQKVKLTQAAMEQGEIDIDIPEGYHLVWQDEFSKNGAPSASEWWYETGAGGWGNNELQNYVAQAKDGTDLAYISDGSLKIVAQKIGGTVYSIRMNTKKYWTYGWFEARLKVSDAPGSWPAFWMMPQNFKAWPDDGEVDIMEYAIQTQGKDKSSSSIHCKSYNHTIGTGKTHVQSVKNAATEYHVYACEWTADGFTFYIDGKAHHTFANDKAGNYNTWPFYNPFYLKLNLAWGGNMGGTVDEAKLPAVYEIDYVRVFQKD
jgi:hypothetical protein